MNSSSDLTISSDWDIIDDEMSQLVSSKKKSEEATSEDLKEKENMQKGSCVDDIIPEQEVTGVQEDSNAAGVPDVTSSEINNHHESSSSSEFDVLDEAVEDNQINLSFSNMEYSISSSLAESSHPSLAPELEAEDAEVEADPKDETPQPRPSQEHSMNVHPFLVAVTLSITFIAILIASAPYHSVQQMKKRVSALQTENYELRNLVHSKLENDKVLMALEEQIKSLKDENMILSESMQSLIAQLEEQTIILKKDKESKVQDPYRMEIELLKQQINILQIDNEELQTQLVRTRYGIYSPHSKESKENPPVEKKEDPEDKTDNKENRDNSSEIMKEEIDELRKKLYAEMEKLKNWKDSVQHLVKTLGNGHAGSSSEEEEENVKSKKPSSERLKESKTGKKGKKSSDWSWGGMKKNLKDTFEGLQDIDVSNILSHYVDKKKIEGVFESVGNYIKKAQEKTKKVLKFDNDADEEVWQFFGQLRNQWRDVTSKYFHKYYPSKETFDKTEYPSKETYRKTEFYKSQYEEHKPNPKMPDGADTHDFETDKKFDRYEKETKPKEASDEDNNQHLYPDLEIFTASPSAEIPNSEARKELLKKISEDNIKFFDSISDPKERKEMVQAYNYMGKAIKDISKGNDWMFKRAAHRSQLREEEQEAFTNWFLRRGKDFHYNEDESLEEWFKETYLNANDDEE